MHNRHLIFLANLATEGYGARGSLKNENGTHFHKRPVLCLQVNLDAEFVLANLDAARRNTSPLVKQRLASDRDLPGCNAMFANELMYITFKSKFLSVHPSFP